MAKTKISAHKNILNKTILFLCLIFASITLPQNSSAKNTLYDERRLCIESKGVWREFGNDCTDSCALDRGYNRTCINKITFSCDCLANSCWDYYQCVDNKAYQKEARKAEKKRITHIRKSNPELFLSREALQQRAFRNDPANQQYDAIGENSTPTPGSSQNSATPNQPLTPEQQTAACSSSNGVWKKFPNGCADSCVSKTGPSICASIITQSCDCGGNRCWNGSACMFTSDFK